MKTILVIIDGAEPADYKYCENINKIKEIGSFRTVNNTPEGMETNSLTCILNILGVPYSAIPKGRAYLEALAINEEIDENDLIFRCNNIKMKNDILLSCVEHKNTILQEDEFRDIRLINIGSYKNLLIIKEGRKYYDSISTFPPHENLGKILSYILPKCTDKKIESILNKLIYNYNLYPWGQSVKDMIPSFYQLHNKKGAVVCKTEIVEGIAKDMNMYVPILNSATADVDTDLIEKAEKALELSKEYDFVLLHINGADESAHRKNEDQKINFINKIDKEVISYLMKTIDANTSLIVTSDHGTSAKSGNHINVEVNYYIL
ncbi:alkaline phosphatase family protein [Clostridium vincentii]|uniref:Cofactor-independent phosphoglycerate mutase n=1 Tax=Clostridium vincentii TaxID=52704 RepID=A0A2T0BCK0_9CLOT|nr:alkaline phosphatase family protein [Clostridium vincentii]PRR81630.1 cofactor-independent phosphoglycerate mutase [Clostridium vincentii]